MFTWWMAAPHKEIGEALAAYGTLLRGRIAPAMPAAEEPAPAVDAPPADAPKVAEIAKID